jgi:hypothetical protein
MVSSEFRLCMATPSLFTVISYVINLIIAQKRERVKGLLYKQQPRQRAKAEGKDLTPMKAGLF